MNSLFHACPFIFSSSCTGGLNVVFLPTKLFKSHHGCQGTPLPIQPFFQRKLKLNIFYSITKHPPSLFHPNKFSVLTIFQNLGGEGRVRPPRGISRMGDGKDAPVSALREQEQANTLGSCCGYAGDRNVASSCTGCWAVPWKMHLISSEWNNSLRISHTKLAIISADIKLPAVTTAVVGWNSRKDESNKWEGRQGMLKAFLHTLSVCNTKHCRGVWDQCWKNWEAENPGAKRWLLVAWNFISSFIQAALSWERLRKAMCGLFPKNICSKEN